MGMRTPPAFLVKLCAKLAYEAVWNDGKHFTMRFKEAEDVERMLSYLDDLIPKDFRLREGNQVFLSNGSVIEVSQLDGKLPPAQEIAYDAAFLRQMGIKYLPA